MPAGIFSRPDAHARREEVPGPDQVPPRLGDAPSSGGIVPRVELAPPARASSQTKLHFFIAYSRLRKRKETSLFYGAMCETYSYNLQRTIVRYETSAILDFAPSRLINYATCRRKDLCSTFFATMCFYHTSSQFLSL